MSWVVQDSLTATCGDNQFGQPGVRPRITRIPIFPETDATRLAKTCVRLVCLALAMIGSLNWGSRGSAFDGLQVESGFGKVAKVGCWTPVRVVAPGIEVASAEVEALDPDGVRLSYPLNRVAKDVAWSGVFRSGRLDADWTVRLIGAEGRVVAEQRVSPRPDAVQRVTVAKQSVRIWAEIGFDKPLLETSDRWPLIQSDEWATLLKEEPRRTLGVNDMMIVRLGDWPEIASSPWACDGLDGILISSRMSLNPAAEVELIRWVRRGGHLVLSVTSDRAEFQATSWAKWLNQEIDVRERTRTSDMTGVESFAIQSRKIKVGAAVPVTILSPQQGRVLVTCTQGPLATQACVGFGTVTVCGLDLTKPPLLLWEGRPSFLKRLLLPRFEAVDSVASQDVTKLSQTGIGDLASQWRAAAIQLPGVSRPTLWEVLAWMLLYAVVIGPLDYVVVHKLFRRPHWTWWTMPIAVLVASLGTVWYAQAANGDAEPLTQLDLLDLDVSNHEARAQSWATTYSRENRLWRAEAGPSSIFRDSAPASGRPAAIVSWLGFPESASGGLYRSSGLELSRTVARTNWEHTQVDRIPIGRWSSKSLTAEVTWTPTVPLIEASFTSPFSGELNGSMTHHFPGVLEDWLVVFEDRVYRPDPRQGDDVTRWEPNVRWSPQGKTVNARVLRGFLTRAKRIKVKSDKKYITEDVLVEQHRYDPLSLEPADILQMLTLHEAAGGKGHTGLEHAGLSRLELTSRLPLGRAVLIARISQPTTEWVFNGTPREPTRSHSFVRALIPVKRQGDSDKSFRVLPNFDKSDEAPSTETKSP